MTPEIQAKGAKAGGLAVRNRTPPHKCLRCGASFKGRSYHSYLAHKGLHGYADRYHSGDLSAAARRLAMNSIAKYDPAPWNGAFKYKPAQLFKPKENIVKTNFADIRFDAEAHRYFIGNKELTSVTKTIKRLQPPFDSQTIAAKVAAKEGRPISQILAEWEAKAEKGRNLGTAVHQYIQKKLLGQFDPQISFDPFLSLNGVAPEIQAFEVLWSTMAPKVSYSADQIEWVIGDADLGIAGTVDMLLFSHETNKYHIWDWKTGKFQLDNPYQTLYKPFDYLSDCQLNVYSLQLSLYRLIIESNTGLDLGDSYLVHLSTDGYQVHRALDLRERLLDWLEVPF
jgi:hypothetical protein